MRKLLGVAQRAILVFGGGQAICADGTVMFDANGKMARIPSPTATSSAARTGVIWGIPRRQHAWCTEHCRQYLP